MSRKVFISVLGTGFYQPCKYHNDQFTSSETRFIQEATLDSLHAEEWKQEDTILMLLTEGAKRNNWSNEIKERFNTRTQQNEPYIGLCQILEKKNLTCQIEPISIPDGKDNEEMWQIFSLLFDALHDEDELYIDLTHSFRYLPMLVLVLSNYSRFLKNVTVKHLSYGNYEARDINTNVAEIINLLPLAQLQEWTFAAANLLQNGDAKELKNICRRSLTPLLRDKEIHRNSPNISLLRDYADSLLAITQAMKGCRAIQLTNGDLFDDLDNTSNGLGQIVIRPMGPIIQKIKSSFSHFSPSPDVMNGYQAAFWCYDHQMYQQSLTILHENIVSHICQEAHFDPKDNKVSRPLVSSALNIHHRNLPEEKWEAESEERKKEIRNLLQLDLLQKLSSTYVVTTNIRNDYNHAGWRDNPTTTDNICKKLGERLAKIKKMLFPEETLLINLTNHPYAQWDDKQKQAAQTYGEVRDLPFPRIDSTASEEEITDLVNSFYEKIRALGRQDVTTIHIMGEFSFTFALLKKLQAAGYICVASTTERIVREIGDNKKEVSFQFKRFRRYE